MSRPPFHPQAPATHGIAALIGGMLGALLYAVLGWMFGRADEACGELDGTLAPILAAEAEISFETEPYVEWIAVPVDWRPLHLMLRERRRLRRRPVVRRHARAWVTGRGPPLPGIPILA